VSALAPSIWSIARARSATRRIGAALGVEVPAAALGA
jgi:hypothetical protein